MTRLTQCRIAWPSPLGDEARLPLPHRLAIAYLMAPALIWLAGWFKWWFGVPAALLLGFALAPALRGAWRFRRPSRSALAIVLLALAWTMLTTHGGVFEGTHADWLDRYAMLLALSHDPWPVYFRDGLADHLPWGGGERSALLRYYLGWYMVPGLVGRLFGAAALHWAVPLWSAAGVALALHLFARGLRGRRAVLAAGMLVLFGGMDVPRMLLMRGVDHYEFALDGLGWPGIRVRYSEGDGLKHVLGYLSMVPALNMGPHIIAAALYALLLAQLRRRRRFVATSGVLLASAVFWGPFVAIGLLPLAAALVCENALPPARRRWSALASWSNVCLAVPLAGLFAVYLSSGAVDFPHGWLWEWHDWRRLVTWSWRFYFSEFLLLLLCLLTLRPRLARRPFFLAAIATLLLLPWYQAGGPNLSLKGVLPALVLLSWFCVHTLLRRGPRQPPGGRGARAVRRLACAGLICALAGGALGPLLQIASTTSHDVTFRFASSGVTMFSLPGFLQRENLAAEVPPVLAKVLRAPGDRVTGGASAPVAQADFDVHVDARKLVFVRDRCDASDRLIRMRFVPANPDTHPDQLWHAVPRWYGAGCGALAPLPGWPVHGARVGQTPGDGGDWALELLFDEAGRFAGLSQPPGCGFLWGEAGRTCAVNSGLAALREAYHRARHAAPVARSHFAVYVEDDRLTYVREPCVFADIKPRFFLHLTPERRADLPLARRAAGFDNRDFAFGEHGALIDGKCVAAWQLPYPVRELRTGQFTAAGEVWRASFRQAAAAAEGSGK